MRIRIVQATRRRMPPLDKVFSLPKFMLESAWFAPALALICVLLIYRRLIAGWVIAGGDLETYFYPYWVAVSRSLRSGQLPLWNPYLFAGVPLLANSQAGVFYPLNWPFWFLAGDTLTGVASAIHGSVLLHVCLASLSMYCLGRSMKLSSWAAAVAGIIYAGGGFLGIHVEHLNQLQALAWMPFVLLLTEKKSVYSRFPHPISVFAMAMILLAGHTQMAFITGVAVVVWRIGYAFDLRLRKLKQALSKMGENGYSYHSLFLKLKRWCLFFLPFIIAGLVASEQLLPTLELVNLSARQGGLDWREAISFSLQPWNIAGAFLPPYLATPLFPEGVAYIGSCGLFLVGGGVWAIYRKRQLQYLPLVFLAVSGVILALGGYNPIYLFVVRIGLPGFTHFRAPVRFLALYVLSAGLLAGLGFDYLWAKVTARLASSQRWYPVAVAVIIPVILSGELMLCADWLPHADATIPRAYTDLRPATSHLAAATNLDRQAGSVPGRFLSISQMLFEVGDKPEIESVYENIVSPDALWSYLISEKQREVLTPNLPLAFRVFAADGYDGGLLPTAPYIAFSRLLIDGGTQDGRLRENLTAIPDRRWLQLMDVRYVMTDKTSDMWVDDILYDRQFNPVLSHGETLTLAWLPASYKADGIGLLYTGKEGQVTVDFSDGNARNYQLPGTEERGPYRIRWENSATVSALSLSAGAQSITLSGISLINEVTGSFYPLTLSDSYRLVHSGDVKIYEAASPPPHAFFVTHCETATTESQALTMMADPSYDPLTSVIMIMDTSESAICKASGSTDFDYIAENRPAVRVLDYEDSGMKMEVFAPTPGFVILSEGWYPGWQARLISLNDINTVQPAPVLRGNLMFRAIPVPVGHWHIALEYQSKYLLTGAIVSMAGIILYFLYFKHWYAERRIVGF